MPSLRKHLHPRALLVAAAGLAGGIAAYFYFFHTVK
jgi:hypothetical protein